MFVMGSTVIRFILGLLFVFGAMSEMDYNENANLFLQTSIALFGCGLMFFGAKSLKASV
jgi:hypothetical protein